MEADIRITRVIREGDDSGLLEEPRGDLRENLEVDPWQFGAKGIHYGARPGCVAEPVGRDKKGNISALFHVRNR